LIYNANEPSHQQVIVGVSVVYIIGYNGMVATYAWLCGGEFPSQRLRSYTFGLAASVGFLGAWLTTFTAPYFINPDSLNWGPKYGYIWTPSCLIGALWVWFYLPEVQNRTFEEIDEMVSLPFMGRHGSFGLLDVMYSSKHVFQHASSEHIDVWDQSPLWLRRQRRMRSILTWHREQVMMRWFLGRMRKPLLKRVLLWDDAGIVVTDVG
jgi:hypothetical protein